MQSQDSGELRTSRRILFRGEKETLCVVGKRQVDR